MVLVLEDLPRRFVTYDMNALEIGFLPSFFLSFLLSLLPCFLASFLSYLLTYLLTYLLPYLLRRNTCCDVRNPCDDVDEVTVRIPSTTVMAWWTYLWIGVWAFETSRGKKLALTSKGPRKLRKSPAMMSMTSLLLLPA